MINPPSNSPENPPPKTTLTANNTNEKRSEEWKKAIANWYKAMRFWEDHLCFRVFGEWKMVRGLVGKEGSSSSSLSSSSKSKPSPSPPPPPKPSKPITKERDLKIKSYSHFSETYGDPNRILHLTKSIKARRLTTRDSTKYNNNNSNNKEEKGLGNNDTITIIPPITLYPPLSSQAITTTSVHLKAKYFSLL